MDSGGETCSRQLYSSGVFESFQVHIVLGGRADTCKWARAPCDPRVTLKTCPVEVDDFCGPIVAPHTFRIDYLQNPTFSFRFRAADNPAHLLSKFRLK
jgi:hypothetical protein